MSCRQVSQLLGDAPRTVAYWVRRFEQYGLTGLTEQERPGRPRRLSKEQLKAIDKALRSSPTDFGLSGNLWDGKTLSAYVKSQWNITLGTRQCQRLFRHLGFRLRKLRSLIAHADPDKQARVKKLRRLARSEVIDPWAMDEVHFQQHGSRCRMWIPPENANPVLLHQPTRRSVGYFGAVRLRDGKLVYRREMDRFNAESCFAFLQQLWAVTLRSDRKIVVIVDNARYHHARLHKEWRRAARPWFRLEFLPPYRPDLNPAERVGNLPDAWQLITGTFRRLMKLLLQSNVLLTVGIKGAMFYDVCAQLISPTSAFLEPELFVDA